MSIFSKILDKLGLRKEHEQPATTGTTDVRPPNPTSTTSKPASTVHPAPNTGPSGSAPTSEKGVSTTPSVADRRQRDDVAVKDTPAPVPAAPSTSTCLSCRVRWTDDKGKTRSPSHGSRTKEAPGDHLKRSQQSRSDPASAHFAKSG